MTKVFKNHTPAFAGNSWQGVELFLQTWGDLPGKPFQDRLFKLTKEQLVELCEFALDAAAQIELGDKHIKFIQERMLKYGMYETEKK